MFYQVAEVVKSLKNQVSGTKSTKSFGNNYVDSALSSGLRYEGRDRSAAQFISKAISPQALARANQAYQRRDCADDEYADHCQVHYEYESAPLPAIFFVVQDDSKAD